jgi:uncharacterized damage-inducible protein DinB
MMNGAAYLREAVKDFRALKKQAERALTQVSDEEFFREPGPETNSLAIIVKHVAGNLRSRWTDFLTTDGEKPDRRRDSEFVIEPGDTRAALTERWEKGWQAVLGTLESLMPADLERTVAIRSEPYTVLEATQRALTHAAGHVGQIVMLARMLAGPRWQTLSIARGKSEEFTASLRERFEK